MLPNRRDQQAARLAECVAPLRDGDRRELRRYWDRVVRQEWVPPTRGVPSPVPTFAERAREAREARRAVAWIAAATRPAPAGPAAAVVMVGEAA